MHYSTFCIGSLVVFTLHDWSATERSHPERSFTREETHEWLRLSSPGCRENTKARHWKRETACFIVQGATRCYCARSVRIEAWLEVVQRAVVDKKKTLTGLKTQQKSATCWQTVPELLHRVATDDNVSVHRSKLGLTSSFKLVDRRCTYILLLKDFKAWVWLHSVVFTVT